MIRPVLAVGAIALAAYAAYRVYSIDVPPVEVKLDLSLCEDYIGSHCLTGVINLARERARRAELLSELPLREAGVVAGTISGLVSGVAVSAIGAVATTVVMGLTATAVGRGVYLFLAHRAHRLSSLRRVVEFFSRVSEYRRVLARSGYHDVSRRVFWDRGEDVGAESSGVVVEGEVVQRFRDIVRKGGVTQPMIMARAVGNIRARGVSRSRTHADYHAVLRLLSAEVVALSGRQCYRDRRLSLAAWVVLFGFDDEEDEARLAASALKAPIESL